MRRQTADLVTHSTQQVRVSDVLKRIATVGPKHSHPHLVNTTTRQMARVYQEQIGLNSLQACSSFVIHIKMSYAYIVPKRCSSSSGRHRPYKLWLHRIRCTAACAGFYVISQMHYQLKHQAYLQRNCGACNASWDGSYLIFLSERVFGFVS